MSAVTGPSAGMQMEQPLSWAEALRAKAESPELLPIAGGTDVMVELNFDRRRPAGLLDLTRIDGLRQWAVLDGSVELGAGVTYAQVIADLREVLPGLAMASRTVGSPQIRNRGTVAGNLGSASPAGDAHPPLLAGHAVVELESVRGSRRVPVRDFFTGVKRSVLERHKDPQVRDLKRCQDMVDACLQLGVDVMTAHWEMTLGDKRDEILDRMKKAMELVLADLWAQLTTTDADLSPKSAVSLRPHRGMYSRF